MLKNQPLLRKVITRLLKILKIFLIVIVCLYTIAYIYISSNKDKIIRQLTEQTGRKLNGKLTIGDADISLFSTFPKIAVRIKDISLTDTMFAQHHHPFFTAKELFANLSISNLISKKPPVTGLRIDNGSVYLFTDSLGYSNKYLMKSKSDPRGGPKKTTGDIDLRSIELNNVMIIQEDQTKKKFHQFEVKDLFVRLEDLGHTLKMTNEADILVHSLSFKQPRGTFLKESTFQGDFTLNYGKLTQILSFDSIHVRIGGDPFNLSGQFDLGDKNPAFTLRIHTRDIPYENIKKLMPNRIARSLSMASLDKPLGVDADLYGPLHGGEPFVILRWKVEDSRLATNFMDFDHASFTGFFNNEVTKGLPRNDPNSVIVLNDLKAEWHGLPVKSKQIQILNLLTPELSCDLRSNFPLTKLNDVIKTNSLELLSGDGDVLLNYKGPIQKNSNTNSFLNGYIAFENGTILYTSRNVELKALTGLLTFQNSDVFIKDLRCDVVNNKLVMNGYAKNLLTLVNTDPNRVKIDYNIFSPSLNLGSFLYLLKKNKPAVSQRKKNEDRSFGDMAVKIDRLLQQSTVDVNLKTNRILYKNFVANNLVADITMLQDRYLINNVSMLTAGGKMSMNAQLLNNNETYHTAQVNANIANVDVKKLFASFDNFGQDAVVSQNLEGNLSTKLNASLNINDDGKVLSNSVNGTVDFSLMNGALNNFEPIKKMQRFIFKKRDFDNIRFAELKDRLEINSGEIKINRMEIRSSVMSLFVEGLYSRRGNTDISIQVPLNNIFKKADEINLVNIGTDKKGGRSIFLRGRPGADGNIDFKLDLFKRFQKDQKAKQ